MKLAFLSAFSIFHSLWGLFSQTSEGAKVWSGKAEVTAMQEESTKLDWSVNLTGSDVNKVWTYVKILHAEGPNTDELVTYKETKEKVINNPSYKNRKSDMTFAVSQSGSTVTIRFTLANLNRTTDMKNYKAVIGFRNDAATYPDLTFLTILVKPHSTDFKIEPEKNVFCLEDKVNLTCKADGIPPAQVSLFLNNKLVQSGNTSVTFSALSLNVKGENNFVCVPNNTAGVGQTINLKLAVKEPPNIGKCRINNEEVVNKSKTEVKERVKVTMSCDVTGSPPLNIKWNKENVQTSLSQSSTLTFGPINRRDSGQYRVTAYNGRECDKTAATILNLKVMYLDEPQVPEKRYKVVSSNSPKAQFKVIVNGNPMPTLVCRREGGSSLSFSNYSTTYQASGLEWTFDIKIFSKQNVKYYCDFSNSAGNRLIKFQLYKKGPSRKVNGTFVLTNETWKEDLKIPSSNAFFGLETKTKQALKSVYENEEFVTGWRILAFIKGSVAVNFQLDVVANVTDPIRLLKDAVDKNGGKLNGLAINRIRTGYSPSKNDKPTAKATKSKIGTIVGIVVGIIFLTLVVAGICCYRRRGERTSARRTADVDGSASGNNGNAGMELIPIVERSSENAPAVTDHAERLSIQAHRDATDVDGSASGNNANADTETTLQVRQSSEKAKGKTLRKCSYCRKPGHRKTYKGKTTCPQKLKDDAEALLQERSEA